MNAGQKHQIWHGGTLGDKKIILEGVLMNILAIFKMVAIFQNGRLKYHIGYN